MTANHPGRFEAGDGQKWVVLSPSDQPKPETIAGGPYFQPAGTGGSVGTLGTHWDIQARWRQGDMSKSPGEWAPWVTWYDGKYTEAEARKILADNRGREHEDEIEFRAVRVELTAEEW